MGAGPTYTDGSVSPSRPFCLGWLSFGCSRQWTAQPWSLLTARCPHHVTAAAIGIRTAPVVLRVPRLLPRAKHTFHLTISYDKASHRVGSLGPTAKIWGVFSQTTRKSFGVQRWIWITNQGAVKNGPINSYGRGNGAERVEGMANALRSKRRAGIEPNAHAPGADWMLAIAQSAQSTRACANGSISASGASRGPVFFM